MYRHGPVCLSGPTSKKKKNWKKKARKDADVRHDLVARVRREIADGTYDTPEKMEKALERLLAELDEA